MRKTLFFIAITLLVAGQAWAGITLPWSSSIPCANWVTSQGDPLPSPCSSDWETWANQATAGGHYAGFSSLANYSLGAGGSGYRCWVGASGTTAAGPRIAFNSPQTEVYVRLYMRFQTGIRFSDYWKFLFFGSDGAPSNSTCFDIGTGSGQGITATNVGGGSTNTWDSDAGETFSKWFCGGGTSSNGSWHCVEIHVKSETTMSAPYDGIIEIWIDGTRIMHVTNANHGLHSQGLHLTYFRFGVNMYASQPYITSDYYIDMDDFSIANTGPIGELGSVDDTTPDQFTFTDIIGASRSTLYTSNQITISGIDASTAISITGGEYSKNGGAYTSSSGTCVNGDTFTVRQTSSASYYTVTNTTLTVGSTSDIYSVRTEDSPPLVTTTFFEENFADSTYADWTPNDGYGFPVVVDHRPGSTDTHCAYLHWEIGDINCEDANGTHTGTIRRDFTASDSVYVSYWVKHSSNWVGSNISTHPHEFYILNSLTVAGDEYSQLAWTKTTAYIEENSGLARLGLQDGTNVDKGGTLPTNLCATDETRAVNGCNGACDGYPAGSCYEQSGEYMNGRDWDTAYQVFSNTAGSYYKGDWHHVEAYFQMNTISGGVGQPNGVIRYWYDDVLVIDHADVIIRTNENATMKWRQFIMGPYMGVASPVAQSLWVDDLVVGNERPSVHSSPGPKLWLTW